MEYLTGSDPDYYNPDQNSAVDPAYHRPNNTSAADSDAEGRANVYGIPTAWVTIPQREIPNILHQLKTLLNAEHWAEREAAYDEVLTYFDCD